MSNKYDFDTSILNIADDFYEAYLRCAEGKNPTVDEYNRTRYEVVNVPAIVNGAFAIELYIKSMSRAGKRKLQKMKHNIKDLLLTLDQSIQDEIKQICDKLEFSVEEFNAIMNEPPKYYWDYPNDEKKLEFIYNVYRKLTGKKDYRR